MKMELFNAVQMNIQEVNRVFASTEVNIDLRDKHGNTALMYIFYRLRERYLKRNKKEEKTMEEIVCKLLENYADVNIVNRYGSSALHLAVEGAARNRVSKPCIRMLLEYGADTTIKNQENLQPDQLAFNKNLPTIGEIIFSSKINEYSQIKINEKKRAMNIYLNQEELNKRSINREGLNKGCMSFEESNTKYIKQQQIKMKCTNRNESNRSKHVLHENKNRDNAYSCDQNLSYYVKTCRRREYKDIATQCDLITQLEDIECTICLEVFEVDVPIYQCCEGHIFCERCIDTMIVSQKCPTCKIKMTNRVRNREVENIIRQVNRIKCINASSPNSKIHTA